MTYDDLTGRRFGRLVAQKHFIKDHMSWWVCVCDCGNSHVTRANALKRGMVRSCGCLAKDWGIYGKAHQKHGLTHHPLYRVFHSMKDRCFRQTDPEFHNYGNRGITICSEWINDPKEFIRWASDNGYKKGLSIDRIDTNGPYSPDNCRFVSMKQQGRNKRNNRLLTLNGQTHCVAEWAEILQVPLSRLKRRVASGWSDKDVLTKPPRRK